MTTTLPGTAPSEESAVASVEVEAPGSEVAVVPESATDGGDEKFVPASRFNGLMGKYQQTENAYQQTQEALAAAQQTIAELQAATPAKEESVTDTSALEAQVSQLSTMLMKERLDNARRDAIKDFPGAAKFADLIIADTPEDVRAMAQLLHERATEPEAGGTTEEVVEAVEETVETAPATAPVVTAGGQSVQGAQGEASPAERAREALTARDFGSFLKAQTETAVGEQLVLA